MLHDSRQTWVPSVDEDNEIVPTAIRDTAVPTPSRTSFAAHGSPGLLPPTSAWHLLSEV